MDRFNELGRGVQLMAIGAVLLFIDLFLPWQDFEDVISFSGWRGVGVIVGILTIILIAWVVVRLASVNVPLPVSTAMTAALLGVLTLIFTIIKLLTILGDYQTIWAWVGVVLAILIAVGAFRTVQEAGGVETLRTEASSLGSSGGAATTAPPAAPAEPATEAPPPPPPPSAEPAPSDDASSGDEESRR